MEIEPDMLNPGGPKEESSKKHAAKEHQEHRLPLPLKVEQNDRGLEKRDHKSHHRHKHHHGSEHGDNKRHHGYESEHKKHRHSHEERAQQVKPEHVSEQKPAAEREFEVSLRQPDDGAENREDRQARERSFMSPAFNIRDHPPVAEAPPKPIPPLEAPTPVTREQSAMGQAASEEVTHAVNPGAGQIETVESAAADRAQQPETPNKTEETNPTAESSQARSQGSVNEVSKQPAPVEAVEAIDNDNKVLTIEQAREEVEKQLLQDGIPSSEAEILQPAGQHENPFAVPAQRAEQLTSGPAPPEEEMPVEPNLPQGHHLERSEWHTIEVDSSGHTVENPTFTYGQAFSGELHPESQILPSDIAVASGQLAVDDSAAVGAAGQDQAKPSELKKSKSGTRDFSKILGAKENTFHETLPLGGMNVGDFGFFVILILVILAIIFALIL